MATHEEAVEAIEGMFPDDPQEKTEVKVEEPKPEVDPDDPEYEPSPEPVPEGDEVDPDKPKDDGEPEMFEVEFDGGLYEVPEPLKDALLRQSDYTQKTQEVASKAKELEIQFESIEQTRKQYDFAQSIQADVLKAQSLEQQADQAHQYLRDNIDGLSSTDIEKLRLAMDDARRERDTIVSGITQKQQEFQQAQEQTFTELLNKGTEILSSRIPKWGDESQKQVRSYALEIGFTEQEIQSVVDPRQVEVLWKASQFDSLQAGKASAVQKVQAAPQIKKARDPMPTDTRRKLDLKNKLKSKSLSKEDKASLIGEDIAKSFGM